MSLRVICLNTWGGRAGPALFDWLAGTSADVYCFQEVFAAPALESALMTDADGHRVHLNLFGELRACLPRHHAYFSPGSRGYVNDSEWTGLDLEYGVATFVGHRLSVVACAARLVFGDFRHTSAGEPPLSRSAQALRCHTPDGYLTIGNIHGLWQREGKHDSDARRGQARAFGALMDSVADLDDARLACGDFNLLPDSDTFAMMGATAWRNLVVEHEIASTRSALYKKTPRYADYALANGKVRIHELSVPQEPIVSDHCPIIVDMSIEPAVAATRLRVGRLQNHSDDASPRGSQ